MLQQILEQMFIDPELLAELSEEEKQVLFFKMRQEQVRRWKIYDEECENKQPQVKKSVKKAKKKVDFLTGRDGCEWVWVMGEHTNDRTIEQILQKEEQEAARKSAEKEAQALREKEEAELTKKMEEERLKVIKKNEQKEAELRRKQEEAALYQSIKEARLAMEQMELEKKKLAEEEKKRLAELEAEEKKARRRSMEVANDIQVKRSLEIFSTMERRRQSMIAIAEEDQKVVESSWREQEKRAREAEEQMRENARKARIEYNESIRRSITLMQATKAFQEAGASGKNRPPLPPKTYLISNTAPSANNKKPRPLRPRGKEMIISWFQKEEQPRGSGKDVSTGNIAPWFHGIINRTTSEQVLESKPVGSFLVRVSERVWGYTISLKETSRFKHFLIDASEGGYQFFGADQTLHKSLEDLVNFHKVEPITIAGQELLKFPCGQTIDPPDYWDLYDSHENEITSL